MSSEHNEELFTNANPMVASEARLKLQAKAKSIRIDYLGLDASTLTSEDKDTNTIINAVKRYSIASALLDGLASTEEGLVIRDISPREDLLTPLRLMYSIAARELSTWSRIDNIAGTNGEDLSSTSSILRELVDPPSDGWRQPEFGTWEQANKDVVLYAGQVGMNYKVMTIYGIRNLSNELNLSSVYYKRAQVKTISYSQLDMTRTGKDLVMITPILYKRGDWMVLRGRTSVDAVGHYDRLQLLGFVCEPIGQTVTG
jgi:hypothetical protein